MNAWQIKALGLYLLSIIDLQLLIVNIMLIRIMRMRGLHELSIPKIILDNVNSVNYVNTVKCVN